jgi:hypothetical protein
MVLLSAFSRHHANSRRDRRTIRWRNTCSACGRWIYCEQCRWLCRRDLYKHRCSCRLSDHWRWSARCRGSCRHGRRERGNWKRRNIRDHYRRYGTYGRSYVCGHNFLYSDLGASGCSRHSASRRWSTRVRRISYLPDAQASSRNTRRSRSALHRRSGTRLSASFTQVSADQERLSYFIACRLLGQIPRTVIAAPRY